MKKSIKKLVAMFLVATTLILAIGSISASASGTITTSSTSTSDGKINLTYSFDVDGNKDTDANSTASHFGQKSKVYFTVTSAGSHTVRFSGASNAGATVYFFRYAPTLPDYTQAVATVSIPVKVTGMPSLSASVTLPAGKYIVKIVSQSSTTYSAGSFTIYNVNSVTNIG